MFFTFVRLSQCSFDMIHLARCFKFFVIVLVFCSFFFFVRSLFFFLNLCLVLGLLFVPFACYCFLFLDDFLSASIHSLFLMLFLAFVLCYVLKLLLSFVLWFCCVELVPVSLFLVLLLVFEFLVIVLVVCSFFLFVR